MSKTFELVDESQLPDGYANCDDTHTLFDQLTCAECGSKYLLEAQREQTLRDVVTLLDEMVDGWSQERLLSVFTDMVRELGIEV